MQPPGKVTVELFFGGDTRQQKRADFFAEHPGQEALYNPVLSDDADKR